HAHAAISARHPPSRVYGLPIHVGIGFLFQIGRRNPELVLLVDAHIDQDGKMPGIVRPEDVGLELGAVPHGDVDVLLDLHLVFWLGRFGVLAPRDWLLHGRLHWLGNRRYQSARLAATYAPASHTSRRAPNLARGLDHEAQLGNLGRNIHGVSTDAAGKSALRA